LGSRGAEEWERSEWARAALEVREEKERALDVRVRIAAEAAEELNDAWWWVVESAVSR
jgi:hypothetical protein